MDSAYFWGGLMGLGFYAFAYLIARVIILPRSNGMVTTQRGIFVVLSIGSALLLCSIIYMAYYFPAPFVDDGVL